MTPGWREQPTAGTGGTRDLTDALASDRHRTADNGRALTPNGWWVGPDGDPDRYELLGAGFSGGEGTTYQARYHGESGEPITVAVKLLHQPSRQVSAWPAQEDWARWRDQLHIIHQVRNEYLVQVRTIFAGAPPHRRGTSWHP
jgi:eukaryotic-like serine/threonine-protein kinase